MSLVNIYTKPGCAYCQAAKEDLTKRGIKYKEISVPGNPKAQVKLAKLTNGKNIVPVIVDGDSVQVGFKGG